MNAKKADRVLIEGPAGRIEIVVADPGAQRRGYAIVSHPHPLHGGTLDNKVVQMLAKAFYGLDYAALRFNFRGVGASEGVFDDGRGEVQDLLAVAHYAQERFGATEVLLAGFSFGGFAAAEAARSLQ
ncbi:MAG: alpha/beta hydrolase, partial [Burkholderiales bacterium]